MTEQYELKWVSPVATALEIAECQWNRDVEKAKILFDWWKIHYSAGTEQEWMSDSARQGINHFAAKHVYSDVERKANVKRLGKAKAKDKRQRNGRNRGKPYEQSLRR